MSRVKLVLYPFAHIDEDKGHKQRKQLCLLRQVSLQPSPNTSRIDGDVHVKGINRHHIQSSDENRAARSKSNHV